MDFLDWLTAYQDFDFELPKITEEVLQVLHVSTGECGVVIQPAFQHEGSFCSSISIKISGNRITMSGNPSRYNRLDNLFGLTNLDDCFQIYNQILQGLGLPPFTKCTDVWHSTEVKGSHSSSFTDGAVITRIDVTSNIQTGSRISSLEFIRALSTQPYRNSTPRLHTNGCTADWLSVNGKASLIYATAYQKANEMRLHSLRKIKNKYGTDSDEYKYLENIINYCDEKGIVRLEQKLKSAYLRRENLRYWGLSDEIKIFTVQKEFLNIQEKLGRLVDMNPESISQRLLNENIVETVRAANTTAFYAIEWSFGKTFDFTKSQTRVHSARLRKIGIDIKSSYDANRFVPVRIIRGNEINTSYAEIPSWYITASKTSLRLVA